MSLVLLISDKGFITVSSVGEVSCVTVQNAVTARLPVLTGASLLYSFIPSDGRGEGLEVLIPDI